MVDSYVCSKAKIKCSCGDKISTLTVFPDRTIWLTGQPQANISDHVPMRNIAPFGKCHTTRYPATGSATAANHGKLTPMPCVPNTPFPWMGGKVDVLLQNQPALLKSSKCKCVWGGTITFTYDGQVDGTYTALPEYQATAIGVLNEKTYSNNPSEEAISNNGAISSSKDDAGKECAPMSAFQKVPLGYLTRSDMVDIEESKAIEYIHQSEEQTPFLPNMVKEPEITEENPKPVSENYKETGRGKIKEETNLNLPQYNIPPDRVDRPESPRLGENLDFMA